MTIVQNSFGFKARTIDSVEFFGFKVSSSPKVYNEENSKNFLHVILEKIDATIIFCNTDIYDIMY